VNFYFYCINFQGMLVFVVTAFTILWEIHFRVMSQLSGSESLASFLHMYMHTDTNKLTLWSRRISTASFKAQVYFTHFPLSQLMLLGSFIMLSSSIILCLSSDCKKFSHQNLCAFLVFPIRTACWSHHNHLYSTVTLSFKKKFKKQ
jgi:hypothetical protein